MVEHEIVLMIRDQGIVDFAYIKIRIKFYRLNVPLKLKISL